MKLFSPFFSQKTTFIIRSGMLFALIGISAGSMLLGDKHYLIDIFSHFQLQYAFVLGVFCMYFIMNRKWMQAGIAYAYLMFLCIYALGNIVVFASPTQTSPLVYALNSAYQNTDTLPIVQDIQTKKPNILALTEANEALIATLTKSFTSPAVYNSEGVSSCAIFSKVPLEYTKIWQAEYPVCIAETKDTHTTIIVVHPFPPTSQLLWYRQFRHFKEIKQYIDTLTTPYILVGDFNASPFSATYHEFFAKYPQNTWYTWQALSALMLPLDHALASFPIRVELGKKLSSDHSPLLIYSTH